MTSETVIKPPNDCTAGERQAFAGLVRRGFVPVREPLDQRIQAARLLGFHFTAAAGLCGVAALKAPGPEERRALFLGAGLPRGAERYELDLGWVFVLPEHRERGIGAAMCRELLARVAGAPVFSTTATDNGPMQRILAREGFAPAGHPYPRRDEHLVLFLRPGTATGEEVA